MPKGRVGKRIRKFDLDGATLSRLVDTMVLAAEMMFPIPKSGPEKREWVIDQINNRINIPIVGEKAEAQVIGFLVDFAIQMYNDMREGQK
jgi:hypothetical protein|tara:strand:+ start:7919 stop:8188 length:270 start_codon:yes stop_codon:yes gene_type:complete